MLALPKPKERDSAENQSPFTSKNPASCACRNQGSSSDLYSFCPDSVSHSVGHLHFSYHRSWPDIQVSKDKVTMITKFPKKTLREPRENNENTTLTTWKWHKMSVMQSPHLLRLLRSSRSSRSASRRPVRLRVLRSFSWRQIKITDVLQAEGKFVPRLLVLLLFRWTLLDDLLVLQSARINHDSESSSAEFLCQS